MASQFLQKQIYWLFWKKAPGPKDHQRHFAIIYSLVVIAYLTFTVYQWEAAQPVNYYQRLNVPLKFDTRELKNSFRSLSLQYHPDKAPQGTDSTMFEQKFIEIRKAYDVLKEPATKGIYDFFGDSVFSCTHCKTERDYLYEVLPGFLGFYVGSFLVLLILSVLGRVDFGKYWRFLSLFSLCSLEGIMLLQSKDPFWFVLHWRTPYERMAFFRQFVVIFFIALSQIGPLLFPEDQRSNKQLLDELESVSGLQFKESTIIFGASFEPFATNPNLSGQLQRKMEKMALDFRFLDADASYTEEYKKAHQRATANRK